jgi:hypothetical protein
MVLDFGNTPESVAFFQRRPHFHRAFECLINVSNECLGPQHPKSQIEEVCLRLGVTCRVDFFEVLFLAVNGHAIGATKLLRGLYERAVTLAYLLKYPDKVKRFVGYAAVSEHKLIQEARKLTTDPEIDAAFSNGNSIADIEQRYHHYKTQFLRGKGAKKVAPSWDIDFASQVRKVGSPFSEYYLAAYLFPTQHTHATLTSIVPPDDPPKLQYQADVSLTMAHALFAEVVQLFNRRFPHVPEKDLEQCHRAFRRAWNLPLNP